MCIICNCDGSDAPHEFLRHYENAQQSMKKACEQLLASSELAVDPDDARRYRQIHKRMVALRREWNALEHDRERPTTPTDGGKE